MGCGKHAENSRHTTAPLKGAGGGVACRTSIERDTVQYSMIFVRTEHQTLRASWGLPSMLTIVGVFDGATDKARS